MDSSLQKVMEEIQTATQGMSPEQLAWQPHGKWSSAQILEHLTLTFSGTAKGMRKALASSELPPQRRTLKNRLATLLVINFGYFPSGRQAPAMTVPSHGDPTNAVSTILRDLADMDAVLTEVENKKGRTLRLPHPVIGPLTISEWRKFHLIHTRHHMKQIVKLRELAS